MSKSVYVILRTIPLIALAIGTNTKAALSASQTFPAITNQLGFHVEGNKLISNASGQQFVPAGYNLPVGYYLNPASTNGQVTNIIPLTTGQTSLDPNNVPLGQTGANTVRLWALDHFPGGGATPNQIVGLPTLVQLSLQQGLVPMLTEGLTTGKNSFDPSNSGNYPVINNISPPPFPSCLPIWDGSCQSVSTAINGYTPDNPTDWGLWQAIQSWTSPANVAMFQANPDLILNPANEWGLLANGFSNNNPNPDIAKYWSDSYIYAINYLRSKGIDNTLVIDAPSSGSYYPAIVNFGKTIENADPKHNTVFSVHAYNGFNDCTTPNCAPGWQVNLQDTVNQLAALDVPVIFGEVSVPNKYTTPPVETTYNYQNLVKSANANKMGWLFWMWDTPSDNPYPDYSPAMYDLSGNSTYGLKTLATNQIYQLNPQAGQAVPFEFSPEQGFFLGLPTFLGLRYLKRKRNKN
jgi:hypothetical protein